MGADQKDQTKLGAAETTEQPPCSVDPCQDLDSPPPPPADHFAPLEKQKPAKKGRGPGRPFVKGEVPPTAWKPGQSGNPGGRPGIPSLHASPTHIIRKWGKDKAATQKAAADAAIRLGLDPFAVTVAEVFTANLAAKAMAGDPYSLREVLQRMDIKDPALERAEVARVIDAITEIIMREVPDPERQAAIAEQIEDIKRGIQKAEDG